MKKITTILFCILILHNANAKLGMALVKNENKIGKWYYSTMVDANTFSWGFIKGVGASNVRYTNFINTGVHANYNIKKNIAFYTGLELRNVGFADIISGVAGNLKYRYSTTYIGAPIGIRIGDLKNKSEVIIGTGFDIPMYLKNKSWNVGDKKNKTKNTEWFSKEIRTFNPYLFAGFKWKGMGLKFQYYPSNYFKDVAFWGDVNIFYTSLIIDSKSAKKLNKKKVANKATE